MALDFFSKFKMGLEEVRSQWHSKKQQSEQAKRERDDLRHLPLCREDAAARIDRLIARAQKDYEKTMFNPSLFQKRNRNEDAIQFSIINPIDGRSIMTPASVTVAFCYFIPDVIRARLLALVDAHMPEEVGPPEAEREKRLAELDREIAELEEEIKAFQEQAQQTGIRIEG